MTPRNILAHHGSSFYLASRFLKKQDRRDATTLYAVCRLIDDLADEHEDESAAIQQLIAALESRHLEAFPVDGFAEMVVRRRLDLAPLVTLAKTAWREAASPLTIADEAALLDYCYGVAGTVGELMCPLIGADAKAGREPAMALGMGMQLTNIARDVFEDAGNARRYLPGTWVNQLAAETIAEAHPDNRQPVQDAIRRAIDLAETYYHQADVGMALIPARNRRAIRIAARLYRAIGLRVRDQGCRYWEGRVSLSSGERMRLAVTTLSGFHHLPQPQDP